MPHIQAYKVRKWPAEWLRELKCCLTKLICHGKETQKEWVICETAPGNAAYTQLEVEKGHSFSMIHLQLFSSWASMQNEKNSYIFVIDGIS